MTDSLKPLDSEAWLRRLGQGFDMGAEAAGALAKRLNLPVARLKAELSPDQPYDRRVLTFTGRFEVVLSRECVVSLEPFEETLSGEFERSYTLSPSAPPVPEDREEAEEFPYEGLSLMDMLADEIALNVTPFPRKPGAAMPEFEQAPEDEEEEKRPNPFAVLQSLNK